MKLLLVSSFLPYPLYSGGHIRLYNLIKELSMNHEITLVCEKRDYQTKKDEEEVEKLCKKVITIKRKKQWSLTNVVSSVFSSNAFLITGHTLTEMRDIISDLLHHETYDLIHCETSYVFQNIPQTTLPIVLVEHNIEYTIYEKYAKQKGKLLGSLLSIDVAKLKKTEEMFWKKADIVVAVSKEDEKIIKKHAKKTSVVSNGVDLKSFKPQKLSSNLASRGKKILFIGDFKYIQNQDAAEYLLTHIYPKLKANDTTNNISLWVVGRKIPDNIKQSTSDASVHFDEHAIQPTAEIFSASALLLAPLRIGGGTQYKILESLAVGTPVVTTTLGKEGLEVKDNEQIIIADSATELAERTYELLYNEKVYKKVSEKGRAFIEATYSWEKIAHHLEEVYASVVK